MKTYKVIFPGEDANEVEACDGYEAVDHIMGSPIGPMVFEEYTSNTESKFSPEDYTWFVMNRAFEIARDNGVLIEEVK